ncbi:hypothetical protein DLAC_07725 [Tieghemostelium lacteum]|uniref:Nop domain-containing protein n=1 Tax=Tieghemostelium lacteum TaxID=361077 RepID=A0A151ZAD2_TIELA|nr:hypothetical protein DLAC_07725 [Tieghemostelium lacteum]|eukprot:KYQ90854.1 hypothetical protein DLAC_07725 [Tieghemostelium lacteum]
MSTLADQFLNDFNDVNDDDLKKISTTTTTTTSNVNNQQGKVNILNSGGTNNNDDNLMNIDSQQVDENEDDDRFGDKDDLMLSDEQIEKKQKELIAKYKDSTVDVIAKLNGSQRLMTLMSKVNDKLEEILPSDRSLVKLNQDSVEHQLIVECNQMVQEIQHEIYLVHKYLLERYNKKFPELSSSVKVPLDYINVVKRIGNSMDLKEVQLNDILPRSTIMVLMVTLSSTVGKPLSEQDLAAVQQACDMGLDLDSKKKKILHYLESRMTFIAPNLTVLVGSSIAAKLIGITGSVKKLSVIPAGNIQFLGADSKSMSGMSQINYKRSQQSLIAQCELIKNIPVELQKQVLRALVGRVSLAARIDASQESSLNGELGQQYKDEILRKIDIFQEPPPSKKEKPLPAPIDKVKKRRGGERARKKKAMFASTDLRKAQNRMSFNVQEDTIGDSGIGMGMIGGQTGKVRLTAQDRGIIKKKKHDQKSGTKTSTGTTSVYSGTQTYVSGLQSVAMTHGSQSLSITSTDILSQNKTSKYFGKEGGLKKEI